MERRTCYLLTVLTLLQLCRAEISDSSPENWYSANVINDGFQPKPLSEIFSTEPAPFSPTNPIIVLPNSSQNPATLPDEFVSFSTQGPPSVSTQIIPEYSQPQKIPDVEITQYTESTLPPALSSIYLSELQKTTLGPHPTTLPQQIHISTLPPPLPTVQTESPIDSYDQGSVNPTQNYPTDTPVTQLPTQSPTTGPPPNYYTVYQPPPQPALQPIPSLPDLPAEISSTIPPLPSQSTVDIQPVHTSKHTVYTTSTTPLALTMAPHPKRPSVIKCVNSTAHPAREGGSIGSYPLRIRVVAPSGSITNVNINPRKTTTTRKPKTTRRTTTRKPKTPKPKKNTYDACMDGCKNRNNPICAVPLSTSFVDPTTLKGFPSVCHMACHNSYKKDPYEKLLDGRCGRLRTRIKTIDSDDKLKRDELNKAHYFIDNGSKTYVEVQALH